jgi:hypothetical protein
MKKLFFSICMLVSGAAAFAQLPSFNLGLKAGINTARLQSDLADEENRLGVQFGVWSRIGGAGFYLQPELYLGSKGSKFTNIVMSNGNEVAEEEKVKFTTLDLPILLGSKVGVGLLNVRFMAGPVISFVVDEDNPISTASQDIRDFKNYKDNAWGLQAGAGVDISKLTFDVRYEAGISNVSNSDKYDQKTRLWHISLGYKLF